MISLCYVIFKQRTINFLISDIFGYTVFSTQKNEKKKNIYKLYVLSISEKFVIFRRKIDFHFYKKKKKLKKKNSKELKENKSISFLQII